MNLSDSMDLMNKVYEIIELFEESKEIETFLSLKKEIENNQELASCIAKIKEEQNTYTSEYIQLKKQVLANKKVKEYKKLENALYFLSLDINRKLKKINSKKSCGL